MDMTSVAAGVQLAITPSTGTTGTEIRGVNLRKRLDQATVTNSVESAPGTCSGAPRRGARCLASHSE